MRELAKGSYCRHRTKSEWGFGVVKSIAAGSVTVFFEHAGAKPIAREYAPRMLQPVALDGIPESTLATLERGEPKNSSRKAQAQDVERACQACALPLNRVVFADKRTWKSCPACSSSNGSFHVLYEYPRAFEQSGPTPGGRASQHGHRDCAGCREEKSRGSEPRFCGTV